jgi:hypothetical protein
MKLAEHDFRWLIAAPLAMFMAAVGVSLWFIDILSHQVAFAGFLAAELVAFSLLLYLERMKSYDDVNKGWVLVGCVSLGVFLSIAMV